MEKFIKRSERKLMEKNERLNKEFTDGFDDINSEETEQKKFAEIFKAVDEESAANSAFTAEKADTFGVFEEFPETDSDIIKKYIDSDEYKYVEEKRAAEIKRGKYSFRYDEKGIDPIPESNPNVDHKILKVKTEHSVPAEETADGNLSADISGTRVVKSVADETADSEEKAPRERFIKTEPVRNSHSKKNSADRDFVKSVKKESKFQSKVFSAFSGVEPVQIHYPEYSAPDKADDIIKFLTKEKKVYLVKMLILAFSLLVSFIFSCIPFLMSVNDEVPELHIFGGNALAYGIVMFIFFLLGSFPLLNDFIGGITSIFRKKADSDTAILLIWLSVFIQNIVLLANPDKIYVSCNLYNCAALVIITVAYYIKISFITRTAEGFKQLVTNDSLCAVRSVEDSHRADKIGQGILDRDSRIAYRAKTEFVDKFINSALSDDPSRKICTKLIPANLAAALLVLVIVAAVTKDFSSAITAFTAVIIVTAPVSVAFSLKWLLDSFNRRTNAVGGVIPGYSAAVDFADNDAVIFDAAELYSADNLNVLKVKTFNNFKLYNMLVYAGAMFIGYESPLGAVFRKAMDDRTDLPNVESLIYEDKQGLSAWIDNRKVLAGSRELLINHNIKVPPISIEDSLLEGRPDRKAVYLSVEGEIAAIIAVSYNISQEVADDIAYLVRHGYTILLRSADSNLNDKFVESQTNLPDDTVKVINTEASEYFKMCRSEELKSVDSCIFSKKDIASSLKVMVSSVMLKNALVITAPLAIISSVLGFLIVALLVIFAGATSVAGYHLILLQAVWAIAGSFACRILAKK